MRFGINCFARDIESATAMARLVEQQGFAMYGNGDSPSISLDPFVALALAALQTRRIRLGPLVTNTQTRHPLIIANQAATLEHVAPGRSFLGLGTGNSGVAHAGVPAATLAEFARAIDTIRRLLAGETVEAGGAQMKVKGGGSRVPILVAGSGPKTLRLAGQIADIVLMNVGVLPEVAADGLRWIREGAEAVGRDPGTVEIWLSAPVSVARDGSMAVDQAKGAAVGIAAYVLRGDPVTKRVPLAVQAKVAQLLREYDYSAHLEPGLSPNYRLADRLGVADYLVERFTIAGTPEDCRRKIERLREIGIENVKFSVAASTDPMASIRLLGETVVTPLASH